MEGQRVRDSEQEGRNISEVDSRRSNSALNLPDNQMEEEVRRGAEANMYILEYVLPLLREIEVVIQEAMRLAAQNSQNVRRAANRELVPTLYSLAQRQLQSEREMQDFMGRIIEPSTNHNGAPGANIVAEDQVATEEGSEIATNDDQAHQIQATHVAHQQPRRDITHGNDELITRLRAFVEVQ